MKSLSPWYRLHRAATLYAIGMREVEIADMRLSHSAKARVCVGFLREQLASGPFALTQ
jgi:hypothetical protein